MTRERVWRADKALAVVATVALMVSTASATTASDLLRQGVDEYGARQFVAARRTLMQAQADREQLSDLERETLDQHTAQVDDAIATQNRLMDRITQAESAAAAGNVSVAVQLFDDVLAEDEFLTIDAVDRARQGRAEALANQQPAVIAAEEAVVDEALPPDDEPMPAEFEPLPPDEEPLPMDEAVQTIERTTVTEEPFIEPVPAEPTDAPVAAPADVDFGAGPTDRIPDTDNSLLGQYQALQQVRMQRTIRQFRDQIERVRQSVARNRFDLARGDLQYARQILEANRRYFDPPERFEELLTEAEQTQTFIEEQELAFERRARELQGQQIEAALEARQTEAREAREARKSQLLEQAEELQRQRRYKEAVDKLDELLSLDPNDRKVQFARDTLARTVRFTNAAVTRKDLNTSAQEQLNEIGEARKAVNALLEFADDWSEIKRRRAAAIGRNDRDDTQSQDARRRLRNIIPEFRFVDQPFDNVITLLQDIQGVNISVDYRALEEAGIARDTPVSANLRDVPFETALQLLLDDVGGSLVRVRYDIQSGVIRISTQEVIDRNVYPRVFSIGDIVANVPNYGENIPDLTLPEAGGGGGGEDLFGEDEDEEDEDQIDSETVAELVQEVVLPDSWLDNGGFASVRALGNQLIVTQTERGHSQIADLLRQLREDRAVQINVETRFLTVESNFLEEIGVDLDVILNQGEAGFDRTGLTNIYGGQLLLPRRFAQGGYVPAIPSGPVPQPLLGPAVPLTNPWLNPGLVPAGGGLGPSSNEWTPIRFTQDSISITDPSALSSNVANSFVNREIGPAFTIGASFLDNLQVDFLVRATQANQRSTVLQAPRLTLFNNQDAYIRVITQQAYVSDLDAVVAEGINAFEPTVDSVNSGVQLRVQAIVSADRKYVTMNLRPSTSELLSIASFPFQLGGGIGSDNVGAVVQLPQSRVVDLGATVSVPDGGTILLGGQKLTNEVEIEAGVPVLSKIPVLKRAFDNRTTVRDDQTLLILVKPSIIIASEVEELNNPTIDSQDIEE